MTSITYIYLKKCVLDGISHHIKLVVKTSLKLSLELQMFSDF